MKKLVLMFMLVWGIVSCTNNSTAPLSLTSQEEEDLLFLREEEKLARDVYLYAFEKYGLMVFCNISQSEQRHMDSVLALLNKYGLEDPALPDRGSFRNADLQRLYDDLTALVDISELEALKAGATIEDLDISDLLNMKDRTDNADLLNLYDNLNCGSRNHMRAFYSELLNRGFIYQAQYITQDELISIINGDREQCGNR